MEKVCQFRSPVQRRDDGAFEASGRLVTNLDEMKTFR